MANFLFSNKKGDLELDFLGKLLLALALLFVLVIIVMAISGKQITFIDKLRDWVRFR